PLLALALGLAGCAEDTGDGAVLGSLFVPACEDGRPLDRTCPVTEDPRTCEVFDLEADFFAVEPYGDGALLRIQRGGRILALTDALVLEISDYRLLRGQLGKRVPVGQDRNIRGALGLFHRCPDSTQSYAVSGLVQFDAFGVHKGDRVNGSFDLEVRDGRSDTGASRVLGVLHGDFDFIVRKGPPYQPFAE
ncbi:MAG: hypothetical protein R3F43_32600, partial [bacterium]